MHKYKTINPGVLHRLYVPYLRETETGEGGGERGMTNYCKNNAFFVSLRVYRLKKKKKNVHMYVIELNNKKICASGLDRYGGGVAKYVVCLRVRPNYGDGRKSVIKRYGILFSHPFGCCCAVGAV